MGYLRPGLIALCCLVLAYPGAQTALAGGVAGKITLEKRLFKKTVSVGVYDLRGQAAEALVTTKPGRFDHVALWLEGGKIESGVPAIDQEMRQIGRQFEPAFLMVPVGSTVTFPNLDPIFHNIFSLSRAQTFDLGYYPKGKVRTVTFDHAGVVQVYCHIHSDMYGVIVVTPSRWYGTPNADGEFSFSKVPAGEYRLAIWQKTAGLIRKKISVPVSGDLRIDVALPEGSEY